MKSVILTLLVIVMPFYMSAQVIKGRVTNKDNKPLSGATVFWLGVGNATTTTNTGEFELQIPSADNKFLVTTIKGYQPDTAVVTSETFVEIKLTSLKELREVVVRSNRQGQYISALNPIKTEIINSTELKKAACCDMAGCFNTNGSVNTSVTNVITNAQELRILGLSGVYNQILFENFPMIHGLTYTYGISNIPGPFIENIYISKGANSVLQGFESISGQINVLTIEPDKADRLFLNLYVNSFQEKQFNAYYTYKMKRWSNMIAFHGVQPAAKTDKDHDSFLDLPLVTRYEVYDKIKYGSDKDFGWSSRIGIRYINENRIGGQVSFDPQANKGSNTIYGQAIDINQGELWNKTAYRFNEEKRIVFFGSGYFQHQDSWYGTTHYQGQQPAFNATMQYEWEYKGESNLKTGLSYRYINLDESIAFASNPLSHSYAGNYSKLESIPGVFAENTLYFGKDKFTWITGGRIDHHNQFGYFFTPRTLLRYAPMENTAIRASIGTGWRTANIFSENSNLLASQRDIIFTEALKPEQAVNYGANFTQKIERNNLLFTFSTDFYRTQFQNQIFPDYNISPTKVFISNFTGTSISNGFQAEISLKLYKRFDFSTVYNYLDVYRMYGGQKQELPFTPHHRMLYTASYQPLSNKWHFDINIHWFGIQQLPDTRSNPIDYQRPMQSKPYTLINAQFTYNFKKLEVYVGCENIFDFRQAQPIISWQNPYSQYFDVSSVWGPTRGREIYAGLRLKIKNK